MSNILITIYIDGLFYKGSGIGRYYESLLKEFSKQNIRIYTCVPKRFKGDFEKDFETYLNNISPIYVNYEKFSYKNFIQTGKILKNLEDKVDLFFYPHINLPFYVPNKVITTVHDLIPFTRWWDRDVARKKLYGLFLKRAVAKSKKIITISKVTKKNLLHYYPKLNEDKIKIIYEFIDEKFIPFQKTTKSLIEGEYLLFVGNRKTHKNLNNLILAFNQIKDQIQSKLVIAGRKDSNNKDEIEKMIDELDLNSYIIQLSDLSDENLINLYNYAKLFVFPSLYEGFGLPPLEAISCNCSVISSNIPVLQEILGPEIACFDPNSIDDIAEKLLFLLTNKEEREKLLKIGRKKLELFNKQMIIKEYIETFKNI
jgi:glycosyltransferase involved in cell wall biosynthesis